MSKELINKSGKKVKVIEKPVKTTNKIESKAVKKEDVKSSQSNCKIITCTCNHTQQDNVYGKSRRLGIRQGKQGIGKEFKGWKCSVCNTVQK